MILTREMAEKAKALIGGLLGVCYAVGEVSNGMVDLYGKDPSFWADSDFPENIYKWRIGYEGDNKRRIFIDSLIGKDL